MHQTGIQCMQNCFTTLCFLNRKKKEKLKEKMKAQRLQELREKGLISPSSDWTIDSDTGEPLRKAQKYVHF